MKSAAELTVVMMQACSDEMSKEAARAETATLVFSSTNSTRPKSRRKLLDATAASRVVK